jgi:ATP-independent RNA helicase DbpA
VTIDQPAEETLDIRQEVVATHVDEKSLSLLQVLSGQAPESALVFCNLKATVAEVRSFLADRGVSSDCLHGDMDQRDRDRVMAMFRNRSIRVLVATDVAARGLDVSDLDLVVNFELPAQTEIYVHRIGRTGRAGKLGRAVSFATAGDARRVEQIEERIGAPLERLVPRGEGADLTARMGTIRIGAGRKDKVRPGDILGALTGEAGGLKGDHVGKIEIHDRHAFVAVSRAVARAAVESLRNGRIKGRKLRATLIEPA